MESRTFSLGTGANALPPRGLRVLVMQDKVILQDISSFRKPASRADDPNCWIDATNAAAKYYDSSSPTQLSQPNQTQTNMLVIPFAEDTQPYETQDLRELRSGTVSHTLVATGFLGILNLPSGKHLVLIKDVKHAGFLPRMRKVYCVTGVSIQPLHHNEIHESDRQIGSAVVKLLESGYLLYSEDYDLSSSLQKQIAEPGGNAQSVGSYRRVGKGFWWTWPMAKSLEDDALAMKWAQRTIYGYIGTCRLNIMPSSANLAGTKGSTVASSTPNPVWYSLISRRSRYRAGVRFITRGVDSNGSVANFVETEQVVWLENTELFSSFRVIRGSIPVFWKQNNGLAKPAPEIETPLFATRQAFRKHFHHIVDSYGDVISVSLVDQDGAEMVLHRAFERHTRLDLVSFARPPRLVAFDFHEHCSGKEYERGLASLVSRLKEDILALGVYSNKNLIDSSVQKGIFRVNCVDCLDRTNVVQSAIAREALVLQLHSLLEDIGTAFGADAVRLHLDSEENFKHLWADNADAISKQYAGTGALKTDMTRTGKRSTKGMLADGMKSAMRVYYKNVVDEARQEAIAVVNGIASASKLPSEEYGWRPYFVTRNVQRVSPGGEREAIIVEFHDDAMYVLTAEGLLYEYPRTEGGLVRWERRDDREKRPRLKLTFEQAENSPLELQFRDGGASLREQFLRSLLAWSESPSLLPAIEAHGNPFRCRVVVSGVDLNSKHVFRNWGVNSVSQQDERMIVCLIAPATGPLAREFDLSIVPLDIDDSGFVLISSVTIESAGLAMGVFASKNLVPAVMEVVEAKSAPELYSGRNAMIAVGMRVAGVSICFIGMSLKRPESFYQVLGSLEMGRFGYDPLSQYERVYICGRSREAPTPEAIQAAYSSTIDAQSVPEWKPFSDGFSAFRNFLNGITAVRSALPNVPGRDMLSSPGSAAITFAMDELMPGRPVPSLPTPPDMSYAGVLRLSKLMLEEIRAPMGSSVCNTYLCFTSDLMKEQEQSRVSMDSGSTQRWVEDVRIPVVASRKEEILSSIVYGQTVFQTNNVMGDHKTCGSFAIPIRLGYDSSTSFLTDGSSSPTASSSPGLKFSVRVRNKGAAVGLLSGYAHVSLQPLPCERAGLDSGTIDRVDITNTKFKQTNSRKVKNYIGKISGYWGKSKADSAFVAPRIGGGGGGGPINAVPGRSDMIGSKSMSDVNGSSSVSYSNADTVSGSNSGPRGMTESRSGNDVGGGVLGGLGRNGPGTGNTTESPIMNSSSSSNVAISRNRSDYNNGSSAAAKSRMGNVNSPILLIDVDEHPGAGAGTGAASASSMDRHDPIFDLLGSGNIRGEQQKPSSRSAFLMSASGSTSDGITSANKVSLYQVDEDLAALFGTGASVNASSATNASAKASVGGGVSSTNPALSGTRDAGGSGSGQKSDALLDFW